MKLKIVEVSGPDSSIQYPIFKDGGRERVIEWISKELGKSQKVIVIAQNGSQIANCEILGVPHTKGLEPTEFFDTFRNNYDVLECDILHIHHPKYLLFSEYIKAKKIVLTHHGLYKEMEYYRHNYTFTETYVSHYLCSIMDIDSSGFTIVLVKNEIDMSDIFQVCFKDEQDLATGKAALSDYNTSNFVVDASLFTNVRA